MIGGTPEQQKHWFSRLAEEGIVLAYGATEPEAGSDLGALKTKAVRVEEGGEITGYRITGRKQWISNGGVADVLGDRQQAFIVPPGDVASLARLIVTLVRDPALRGALAAENRERVRRYSTPAVADMFVERVLET